MRISKKHLLAFIAVTAALCAAVAWFLKSRASDWWGYSRLGVNDGTTQSPVYYVEVRGVGDQPTLARVVRFPNHDTAPINKLEISHAIAPDVASHIQNADRWNSDLILLAGRTNDEKIEIHIPGDTAQRLFGKSGSTFDTFDSCNAFWDEHVARRLPPDK